MGMVLINLSLPGKNFTPWVFSENPLCHILLLLCKKTSSADIPIVLPAFQKYSKPEGRARKCLTRVDSKVSEERVGGRFRKCRHV